MLKDIAALWCSWAEGSARPAETPRQLAIRAAGADARKRGRPQPPRRKQYGTRKTLRTTVIMYMVMGMGANACANVTTVASERVEGGVKNPAGFSSPPRHPPLFGTA